MARKQPRVRFEPKPVKRPRIGEPSFHEGLPLAWKFSQADRGGPWPWSAISPESRHALVDRMSNWETMTQTDLRQGGSHPVPVSGLCREAQLRLAEIEQDDLDEMMSFRLSNRERLWCIRDRNLMRVLWWDPAHEVWPTQPRNT